MTTLPTQYQRVEAELRERIATGVYRSGEQLPAEVALCREFGLSRITIRRALEGLAASHLVTRQRGRGTLVADPDSITKSLTLTGFIEDAIPWNRYEVLSDEEAPAPKEVAEMLHLPEEKVMRRVVAVNRPGGKPLSVSEFFFPSRFAGLVRPEDFVGGTTVVRLIESRSGMALAHAEQLVEAAMPPKAVARHLGIAAGTPVLRTLRCFFAEGRVPFQAVWVYHHPERYRFQATLLPKVVPLRARRS